MQVNNRVIQKAENKHCREYSVKFVLTMDARLPVGEIPAKARRPGFFLKVDILLLLLRMTAETDALQSGQ